MILMVTRNGKHCYAEIQLRTISQDTWAALEHHLTNPTASHGGCGNTAPSA